MGIYVGRLPSHASNVGLILNPLTGHVLPQFHVVYDDDFTTVPYLCTATVPPHWAKLVCTSLTVALYTESKVGTWQSLPKLDVDLGDFALDTVNVDTASSIVREMMGILRELVMWSHTTKIQRLNK
jgi:hypothetical protein